MTLKARVAKLCEELGVEPPSGGGLAPTVRLCAAAAEVPYETIGKTVEALELEVFGVAAVAPAERKRAVKRETAAGSDDDEPLEAKTFTAEELAQQRYDKAKADGDVVELSDDDGEAPPKRQRARSEESPQAAAQARAARQQAEAARLAQQQTQAAAHAAQLQAQQQALVSQQQAQQQALVSQARAQVQASLAQAQAQTQAHLAQAQAQTQARALQQQQRLAQLQAQQQAQQQARALRQQQRLAQLQQQRAIRQQQRAMQQQARAMQRAFGPW